MSFIRAPGLGRGSISALIRYGINQSLTREQCLMGTSIKHDFDTLVEDPEPEQEIILIENLIRHFGKPFATGFAVGINYRVDQLGVLGLALMSSRDGSHAVDIAERYLECAFNFTQFSLQRNGDKVSVEWKPINHYSDEVKQFLIARDIGIIHFIDSHINFEMEARKFHKLGFTFDYLVGMDEVSKVFGCPVLYNQKTTYVVSQLIHLQKSPPFSNPANAKIIEETYFKGLKKHEPSLSNKIKQRLISELNLNIQKKDIANYFNMSERTLARHLSKEAISWRKLLSEVRIEKAEMLLKSTQKSIQQICDQVGFANLSSFSHAFNKKNNISPSEFRRIHCK